MAPYDDWNKIDDDEEDELQDYSVFESKRDVILFCIDCSESMLKLYDDPKYEEPTQTCHLYNALDAAMKIQKKKILVGPNDSVGILLFNTTRKSEAGRTQGSEIKGGTYLYQPIGPLSAPKIQELIQLLDESIVDQDELRKEFPPLAEKRVPMGDVFTSCNWVLRDGAPKTATKRVFLITDEDNPHSGPGSRQLTTSARTTLIDLTQAGVTVEPFFISTEEKPFDISKFYSSVLVPTNLEDDDELQEDGSILPESISVSRIGDLLDQMRFREVPKRSLFSVPFHLADGFTIGVKGYGLVTEQKKGSYKYFVDLGDRMEVANVRTTYVDEDREAEVDKVKIVYGADLGASAAPGEERDDEESSQSSGARVVKAGNRPFYTAEEIRSFRTLGLEPGIKLLGFKDLNQLEFEDNVKHPHFIYPDEMTYSGSKRTFSALLKSMIAKRKIGIALVLARRNATPQFCALLPQAETPDASGWSDPAGFHLIPLPFADDIRQAPIQEGFKATGEKIITAACEWVDKLIYKKTGYEPDSYPNPALAFHNEQLEASAFREEYDPETFVDLTKPPVARFHKRAGSLMKAWKNELTIDPSASVVIPAAGSKRKADVTVDEAEIRSKYKSDSLAKLRVDQLKDFLKSKGESTNGKKEELVERVRGWCQTH